MNTAKISRFRPALTICLLFISVMAHSLKKDFEFMGLKLGQTQDEVTNIIYRSEVMKIDESRFFGNMNEQIPFIIKANYFPMINNLYVQFYSNASYGITIQFNPNYFDFLGLSETLQDKYGGPKKRTSKLVEWEDAVTNGGRNIRLRLEHPSTVKVYDHLIMKKVNTELSQNIVKYTNTSYIQSTKRMLLNEL